MSDRPGIFVSLLLPGIVAGMLLMGVLPVVFEALFPEIFREVFPRNTPFLILAVAIGTASTIGLLNLMLSSRSEERNVQNTNKTSRSKDKIKSPPGGVDAF